MLAINNLLILSVRDTDIDEVYKIEKENFVFGWSKEYFYFNLKLAKNKDICKFYIAKIEPTDTLIGYIICHISDKTAHILNLSVKKEYQNLGVGSKLLEFLLNTLSQEGIQSVILEVRVSNKKAVYVYKKFGFFEIKLLTSFYPDGEDALLMLKNL